PEHIKVVEKVKRGQFSADGVSVDLRLEVVERSILQLENTVVGKVLGRRLPFFVLESEIRRQWGRFGEFQLSTIGVDCFACTFNSADARDAVLCGGPWFFSGNIVGLDKWTPEFSPRSLEGLTSPVWIRLPQLPLQYWDQETLIRIASMIGEPMWIDAQTGRIGRREYARVCVKLDLARKLQSGIWINGWKGRFYQHVEYEGLGLSCFECGRIGHRKDLCPARANAGCAAPEGGHVGGNNGKAPMGGATSSAASNNPKPVGVITPCNSPNPPSVGNISGKGNSGDAGQSSSASTPSIAVGVCTPKEAELTEDERMYGPWNVVPPRKGRKPQKKEQPT
ncbi:uncharacterized protein LOC110101071, partial [Dendrobium catenatum]|uniref:uncharacterized protein LOC110101071 n=1 Tax=Dendrobium catenatum TaxID=906689 RepID=UPI0009F5880A